MTIWDHLGLSLSALPSLDPSQSAVSAAAPRSSAPGGACVPEWAAPRVSAPGVTCITPPSPVSGNTSPQPLLTSRGRKGLTPVPGRRGGGVH